MNETEIIEECSINRSLLDTKTNNQLLLNIGSNNSNNFIKGVISLVIPTMYVLIFVVITLYFASISWSNLVLANDPSFSFGGSVLTMLNNKTVVSHDVFYPMYELPCLICNSAHKYDLHHNNNVWFIVQPSLISNTCEYNGLSRTNSNDFNIFTAFSYDILMILCLCLSLIFLIAIGDCIIVYVGYKNNVCKIFISLIMCLHIGIMFYFNNYLNKFIEDGFPPKQIAQVTNIISIVLYVIMSLTFIISITSLYGIHYYLIDV